MDVEALSEVVVMQGTSRGLIGWQAVIHRGAEELGAVREEQLADVVHGKTRLLHIFVMDKPWKLPPWCMSLVSPSTSGLSNLNSCGKVVSQ